MPAAIDVIPDSDSDVAEIVDVLDSSLTAPQMFDSVLNKSNVRSWVGVSGSHPCFQGDDEDDADRLHVVWHELSSSPIAHRPRSRKLIHQEPPR